MTETKAPTLAQQKKEELFLQRTNGYDVLTEEDREAMERYCTAYKHFLDEGKTERECVSYGVALAQQAGFRPLERGVALQPGDKVYRSNRGKGLMLAVIGSKPLSAGAAIAAAHIDSPRLDLKQNPLYEEKELAYCKTHYYGGIKKYQWTTIPLALHGLVVLRDGTEVPIRIGEEPGDPQFTVGDLLPHLAADQGKKTMGDIVKAEQLNLFVGSVPLGEKGESDRVKLGVLDLLHEKYGMVEEDFLSAELMAVPAAKAVDVGLDRSVIGAYGQDDRVCAFACLQALLDLDSIPETTAVCVLADKEEVGSLGVTGMQSAAFDVFMSDLCQAQGVPLKACYETSLCLSADVTAAYDPTLPMPMRAATAPILTTACASASIPGPGESPGPPMPRRSWWDGCGGSLPSTMSSGSWRSWERPTRGAAAPWPATWPTGTSTPLMPGSPCCPCTPPLRPPPSWTVI